MNSFSGNDDLVEFVSQDVSNSFYRQVVVTRLQKMQNGRSPDLTKVPHPGFFGALTGIVANFRDGIARIDFYFQGERAIGVQDDLVQSAEGGLSTDPITAHPKIASLVSQYAKGMRSGKILWKEYVQGGGSNGTDINGNAVSNLNPFSNVESFLNPSMTYTIAKSFKDLPNLQLRSVGKIARSAIFGNLPQLPTNYGSGWLYGGFAIQQRGAVYQATLHYLKSAPGGWQEDIYG